MKLSSKARGALPASKFAGPGRSFPIPDKSHARIAPSTAAVVKSKARRMLGETSGHTNAEGPGAPAHFAAMKKL